MARIPFTDVLCVYAPPEHRPRLMNELRRVHPNATICTSKTGWLVLESPRGLPHSPLLGGDGNVRVVLGESQLIPDKSRDHLRRWERIAVRDPSRLQELEGDFCFFVLGVNGQALAVRPCSGNPRVYCFFQDGVTAVSTRLEWIARVHPRPLALNVHRLVSDEHALGDAVDHSSVIEGIFVVPVGHAAHCGRWATPRLVNYWPVLRTPPRPPFRAAELGAVLREALEAELRQHLDPDGDNALLFSGGLDSSLLAGLCRSIDTPLDAVSILPPRNHPAFARERYFIHGLSRFFRQHHVATLDPRALIAGIADHRPSLSPVVASEWQALAALERKPRAILSGWFADECFGHLRLPELFKDRLPSFRAVQRVGLSRELVQFWWRRRKAGRSPFLTEGLGVPALFRADTADRFVGWLKANTWTPRPEKPAERLRLHRRLTDISGAYDDAAAEFPARVITPFASRRVIELAASCEIAELYAGGLAKAPLRALARLCLPAAFAERTDKGDWGLTSTELAVPHVGEELAHILDTQYLRDHPTLSLDEVGTILWVQALERGRARIEHERRTFWPS